MDDFNTNLAEYLEYIPCSSLNYQQWINVGMALKHEGYPCSLWESWSRADSRFKEGECNKKWGTFEGAAEPVTGGTIIQYAKDFGYDPSSDMGLLDWDDEIGVDKFDLGWIEADQIEDKKTDSDVDPYKEIVTYLDTLFQPDEKVNIVVKSFEDDDKKLKPSGYGANYTVKTLMKDLAKHKTDICAAIGDYDENAGAWVRFNPMDGNGVKNDNVTAFRYALIESDELDISMQSALIREMKLPVAVLVNSGGKSLHAIVRVDAPTKEIYKKRVDKLYSVCLKYKFKVDTQNKNASRLSRLPGIKRKGKWQYIVDTNIGCESWEEWEEWIQGELDDLPEPENLFSEENFNSQLSPEVIAGILRQGRKMILTGASKAGKSFLLIELAISIAIGRNWLGHFCTRSKVLYINFELAKDSFTDRLREICSHLNIDPRLLGDMFDTLTLRGMAKQFKDLLPGIKHKVEKGGYKVVILDPIYKTLLGDENDAKVVSEFCNALDNLSATTGCTVIFCHHHNKSAGESTAAQNRSSGSGVFARDPDAIVDLLEISACDSDGTPLEVTVPEKEDLEIHDYAFYMRMETALREFPPIAPTELVFNYPVHYVVKGLERARGVSSGGSNLTKSERSKKGLDKIAENKEKRLDKIIDAASLLYDDIPPTLDEVAEYFDGAYGFSKDTIEKLARDSANPLRIKEQNGIKFVLVDGAN
ncbi:MAG: AAA family ATPase [Firmicutes bacterium]|nr:AAA family ATPase [Bacillota bacterium]MBQ5769289.1 AAA family ATPase [Clostridiales bacterium]